MAIEDFLLWGGVVGLVGVGAWWLYTQGYFNQIDPTKTDLFKYKDVKEIKREGIGEFVRDIRSEIGKSLTTS